MYKKISCILSFRWAEIGCLIFHPRKIVENSDIEIFSVYTFTVESMKYEKKSLTTKTAWSIKMKFIIIMILFVSDVNRKGRQTMLNKKHNLGYIYGKTLYTCFTLAAKWKLLCLLKYQDKYSARLLNHLSSLDISN